MNEQFQATDLGSSKKNKQDKNKSTNKNPSMHVILKLQEPKEKVFSKATEEKKILYL